MRQCLLDVGWKADHVAAHLKSMDITSFSLDDYVDFWAHSWFESTHHGVSFVSRLKAAGMRTDAATYYGKLLKPIASSYTSEQLLDILLEVAAGKFPFIPRVPLGQWPYETFTDQEWNPIHIGDTATNILNVPWRAKLPAFLAGKNLLFHATTWQWALDIQKYGIKIMRGRKCLDFGYNPSFYMTPHFATVYRWCREKQRVWNGQCAIVVFANPPLPGHFHKMSFIAPTFDWASMVRVSRACDVRQENAADEMDIVEGPILSNPVDVILAKAGPKSRPLRFQCALKSTQAAKWFDRELLGILFLGAMQTEPTHRLPTPA